MLKQAPPAMPVELLFLDGEEAVRTEWVDPDNRYGSRYYVETRAEGRDAEADRARSSWST